MLNRDFAGSTLNIIRGTNPNITAPIQPDWEAIIRQAGKDYQAGKQLQADNALTEAMVAQHPEDETIIRQKGGRVYADELKARQEKLDDLASQRDFQREMLDAQTQRAFALENMRNQNARSLAEFKAGLGNTPDTNAQRNVAAMIDAGYSPQEAWAMYYGGNNPTFNMDMLGKKGKEAADKKIGEYVADEQIAQQQMRTLKPKAENALRRAKESLVDGEGLGQFGGWGWTTEKGGVNRANIKNAQAQINTTMRGLLKQMGVGSTELNSAAEAEAYRYMLDPNMPIGQQVQVLKNFEEDYLSGALQKDLAETYGNKGLKQFNQNEQNIPDGTIIEDNNGNRMILRGGQWQQM